MAVGSSPVADGVTSSVAASATSVSLFSANGRSRKRIIFNEGSTILYVRLGSGAASVSNYSVQIAVNGAWELPNPLYCGAVTGIWAGSPTGSARLTEY